MLSYEARKNCYADDEVLNNYRRFGPDLITLLGNSCA